MNRWPGLSRDLGANLLGILKWLVKPLWRACWSLMLKISSNFSTSGPTSLCMKRSRPSSGDMFILKLQLSLCSSWSCNCPKTMSLWINFVRLFVSLLSHFWHSFFPPTPALSTISRALSSSMCSITPKTANVGSSYNRMQGPGIGC